MSLFAELKRRNVFRVGIFYAVLSWLILQVADVIFGVTQLPEWSLTLVAIILGLGFIPALIFAWIYELTPEGIKLEKDIDRTQSVTHHTARKLDIAVIVLLIGIGAMVVVDRFSATPEPAVATTGPEAEPAAEPAPRERSIAVLPFADMSEAGDQGYFADGVSEEILNALTRLPDLKVAGRTSSFKFRNVEEDLRKIGEELGVANILEGSVRKTGNRVRITVQLIDSADGFHLWSETFERSLSDIFAVQDEISRAVADALAVQMSDETMPSSSGTTNITAHDTYLRARELLHARTGRSITQAATLFEAATLLDPEFDQAWSGLARTRQLNWNYLGEALGEEAAEAANRALEINPQNAEAHSVLALVNQLFFWDWDAAIRETDKAVALAPNNAEIANFAGDIYRWFFDETRALEWEQLAADLDPLHAVNRTDLGYTYLNFGQCAEASEQARAALEIDPGFLMGFDVSAWAAACAGELQEAQQWADRLREVAPGNPFGERLDAQLAARMGDEEKALARIDSFLEREPFVAAVIYVELGQNDAASQALGKAYRLRDPTLITDFEFQLPENWPDDPGIQAALDKPELNALYEIRRRNLGMAPTGKSGSE